MKGVSRKMVLTLWSLRPRYTQPPDLCNEYSSISIFCTFKINHVGSFTNTVYARSYIDGLVDHFDFVDMDVFSVHELDDMMAVLGVVHYFKSLVKVRIEEVEGNDSPELNRVKMKRKSIGSCSKKLDLNESTNLSKLIVPYEPVINKKHSVDRESDLFKGYSLRITMVKKNVDTGDEHQPKGNVDLVDDYEVMGDVDAEYGGGGNLHDVEFFEDEYSGSKESVQKTTKETSGSGVDFTEGEDLEVIDPESFESPIVDEDNSRERMLRDIRKEKSCSEGLVHQKAFTLGQKFKTKKDVKEYINKHAVETKRGSHFEKNDKTRIRDMCRGVVSDMTSEWKNTRW
ncbi:unnamed protein product [Lactuca saligna]|uniref:Transposase MuDR plant domain-containing protein n=1 Tax=Lactuca saligna TaxID=75948 RepID=A0AA35YST5_LACSI|nr:unnamed protein product [Lactuca saligna]